MADMVLIKYRDELRRDILLYEIKSLSICLYSKKQEIIRLFVR